MKKPVFKSLSAKLCFYILLLSTIIFGSIAAVFLYYGVQREEMQAFRYTEVLMRNVLQKTQQQLSDVERTLKDYRPVVEKSLASPDKIMDIAEDIVLADNFIVGASVAFEPSYYPEKGELFMEYAWQDSLKHLHTKHFNDKATYDYTQKEWFRQACQRKRGTWSEPYYDAGDGNVLMTTYTLPLLDAEGHVYGVLAADISLRNLVVAVKALRPYPDSFSFILSNKGTFISHPDTSVILKKNIVDWATELDSDELKDIGHDMLAQKEGLMRLEIDDTDVLACYVPLKLTEWSMCSLSPYSTIISELGNTHIYTVAIFLIGLVLLTVCIRQIMYVSMRPLRQLTEASNTISTGHFDYPLPHIDTSDEMRRLHDAFAHMQTSLKQYIAELTETTRAKERIDSELNVARGIQMSLLPHRFPPYEGCEHLELAAFLQPAKQVGGDYYDFQVIQGKLFFVVGDVSGKGVPAAMVMGIARTMFRIVTAHSQSPSYIASVLNKVVSQDNDNNMFITMFIGVLDLDSGRLAYCNAGHNPPLLLSTSGECSFLDVEPNIPVGAWDGFEYQGQEMLLPRQAVLLLYTDGLTEAENEQHALLGDDRVAETMRQSPCASPRDIVTRLQQLAADFAGNAPQSDDLTLMCLRLI